MSKSLHVTKKGCAKTGAALEKVSLADRAQHLPGELSGGQRQRISIARTLISEPDILILDDSSSALDYATDARLRMSIRENYAGKTTSVIVAQRISTTKRADRVVIIENGKISDVGTHEELISRPGYYREVYELQNGLNGEGGVA